MPEPMSSRRSQVDPLIGILLRAARQKQKRSQESIAWSCNISQSKYSEIERGASRPSTAVFVRLARELNIERSEWPPVYAAAFENGE